MASRRSPSLCRRLDALTKEIRRRVAHCEEMRAYASASASIRAALAEADIDPAGNGGLRYFAHGEREVSGWPDTAELRRADASFVAQDATLASRKSLVAEAEQRAARFAGRPRPDPRTMSPFDWYAWSLAGRSGEAPNGGEAG